MPASFNYSKKKPSSVNKSNSPKEDAARQKLRTLLMDSLHAMPSPAPAGFPKWTVIQKEVPVQILKKLQRSAAERGGDPITLLVCSLSLSLSLSDSRALSLFFLSL